MTRAVLRRFAAAAYLGALAAVIVFGIVANIIAPQYAYYTAGAAVVTLGVGFLGLRFWPEE